MFIKENTVIGFSGQLTSWAHCFKVRKKKNMIEKVVCAAFPSSTVQLQSL